MKKCYRCKIEKLLEEFYKDSHSRDGYNTRCKDCCKEYAKLNKEKIQAYRKVYNKNGRGNFKPTPTPPMEKNRAEEILQSTTKSDKWDLLEWLVVEHGAAKAVEVLTLTNNIPDDEEYRLTLDYLGRMG